MVDGELASIRARAYEMARQNLYGRIGRNPMHEEIVAEAMKIETYLVSERCASSDLYAYPGAPGVIPADGIVGGGTIDIRDTDGVGDDD